MTQTTPTDIEATKYAESFILHGDKTRAFRETFPDSKAKPDVMKVEANKFHKIPNVSLTIERLREKIFQNAESKATYTIEECMLELEQARTMALIPDDNGRMQTAAAVSASMGKAKIAGLIVDKSETKGSLAVGLARYQDDDLEEIIRNGRT